MPMRESLEKSRKVWLPGCVLSGPGNLSLCSTSTPESALRNPVGTEDHPNPGIDLLYDIISGQVLHHDVAILLSYISEKLRRGLAFESA